MMLCSQEESDTDGAKVLTMEVILPDGADGSTVESFAVSGIKRA